MLGHCGDFTETRLSITGLFLKSFELNFTLAFIAGRFELTFVEVTATFSGLGGERTICLLNCKLLLSKLILSLVKSGENQFSSFF